MSAEAVWRLVLASAFVLVYYGVVKTWVGSFAGRLAPRLAGRSRRPPREVEHALRLALAVVSQAACFVLVVGLLGISRRDLGVARLHGDLLVLGAALGLGEMAVSRLLCEVGMRAAMTRSRRAELAELARWLTLARAGWIQTYINTLGVLPMPLALLLIVGYVAVEEAVFRGLLLTYLLPAGPVIAYLASVVLFGVAQVFRMPSWRAAMFPVIGGLVVGTVHGALFLQVRDLPSLIVAHVVFFFGAVQLLQRANQPLGSSAVRRR
jgi:membrane protease YdiL (CAAX protease family)